MLIFGRFFGKDGGQGRVEYLFPIVLFVAVYPVSDGYDLRFYVANNAAKSARNTAGVAETMIT